MLFNIFFRFRAWFSCLVLLGLARVALSQTPATPAPADSEDDGFVTDNSDVGYIDPAIPRTTLRFRYDAAFDNPVPNRGEFFYAGPPRGIRTGETSVDYQEVQAYLEWAATPQFSTFVELPVRFLNPEIQDNVSGLSDVNAGFKYAFFREKCQTATFQLRGYAPTGRASVGLGTGHVSVEPALLYYRAWTDRLRTEAEFRTWVPIGGTDFAGTVLRYGVGASYTALCLPNVQVSPVIEFVNWTFLGGQKSQTLAPGVTIPSSASGDHILNVKIGSRVRLGEMFDIYAGYGRPLTGETFYNDVFRLELRLRY